ncbi:MAG TPA: DUF1800 family protein [Rhabdaerophilum sp.]|nr:DUF1800 family protein [Rhabdaerophilum sp.]
MAGGDELYRLGIQRFALGGRQETRATFGNRLRDALVAEVDPKAALLGDSRLPDTARAIQIVTEIQERQREARAKKRQLVQTESKALPSAGNMQNNDMLAAPGNMTVGKADTPQARPPEDPDAIRARDLLLDDVEARLKKAVSTDLGFAERWVAFWSNHFCVALRRGQIMQGLTGAYERVVIRAHAFGRFGDMLVAVETHPAMLHYLDQRQSVGPNSPAGKRRTKGLNENLAREILELHTLGVGGGYSQQDVTNFAKALTGWSISNFEEMIDGYGGFFFAPNRHEPGPQVVLGKSYPDTGKGQGLSILADLAQHPATARFVAGKVARHFVSDTPAASLVARLEQDFRRSGGDLASLARSLLTAPESWQGPTTKLRTPYEFVVASLRATDTPVDRVPRFLNALNLMGQPLWNPEGPNGHADGFAIVASPKAIKTRLEFALQLARPAAGKIDPRERAEALYGSALSGETRTAIARAETRPQGLALLLMSPEFQRR